MGNTNFWFRIYSIEFEIYGFFMVNHRAYICKNSSIYMHYGGQYILYTYKIKFYTSYWCIIIKRWISWLNYALWGCRGMGERACGWCMYGGMSEGVGGEGVRAWGREWGRGGEGVRAWGRPPAHTQYLVSVSSPKVMEQEQHPAWHSHTILTPSTHS